jgi:endonuclease/exonuclease/phosphatase family metal-dependent hydrolase
MTWVTVATYNVENLFERPKAFTSRDWSVGAPILAAHHEFTDLSSQAEYTDADRQRMIELLLTLGIYHRNGHGAVRRRFSSDPPWAWLRKNRGTFDREPADATESLRIIAKGRDDWIGWVELATGVTDEVGVHMTGRVVNDVDADIIAVVEAEDRPSLQRFNRELLGGRYRHVMLVDGNDARGIDVGLMTKAGFEIRAIRSHVDIEDGRGLVFDRDCPVYRVHTPGGAIHLAVNHFKSQSGRGRGAASRARQAAAVRAVVDRLVDDGERVIVLGDLNEGQPEEHVAPTNLGPLFDPDGPLVSCYEFEGFDPGPRPGTFQACALRERLDYLLVSRNLAATFRHGTIHRRGLWGSRVTRPTAWETYPEMQSAVNQASDHAAVSITLDL